MWRTVSQLSFLNSFDGFLSFIQSGTAALEEDAQILKVIEAYCTSAKTRQTLNSSKIAPCTSPPRSTDVVTTVC